jgi:hypothetical protein
MPLNMVDGLYQGEDLEKARNFLKRKEAAREEFNSGMEGRSWCFVGDDEIDRRKTKYNETMLEIEKEELEFKKNNKDY